MQRRILICYNDYMTLEEAEVYAQKTNNVYWDGWTLCVFRFEPLAAYSPKGIQRTGIWGYERRIEPNKEGRYELGRGPRR